MIDIQQKWQSQSPKDWFLSVCGLIVLLVGMGGLLLQLLSPLTMIGSVNYIVMGASILFVYSHNARSIGYSLLPDNVKYAVFDM